MTEYNKSEIKKLIEDNDLGKVSGGLTGQDVKDAADDIAEVLKGIGTLAEKFGDLLQLIKTAIDTNTCPLCNQDIVPLAEKCELMDFVNHIKAAHSDMQ